MRRWGERQQANWFSPHLAIVVLLVLLALLVRIRNPHSSVRNRVVGQVLDANDCPVAGARVRIKGTNTLTTTDARGQFKLPGSEESSHITASARGHFIAGSPASRSPLVLRLSSLPEEDHADYQWVDPAPGAGGGMNCGNCHGTIFDEWKQSGHARSASGLHFRNLYTGEDVEGKRNVSWGLLTQYEEGAAVCASCHAPAIPDNDPAQFDLRDVKGVASHGVHCDFCHKIADVRRDEFGLRHGRYNLDLLRPSPRVGRQIFFGPLDDVDRGEDVHSPLYGESAYCASCHEGVVFGVPVYTTYSEWRESQAGRMGVHCQQCHMTPTGRMTNMADGPPPSVPPGKAKELTVSRGIQRDPRTLANHLFFAGSHEEMLRRCLRIRVGVEQGTTEAGPHREVAIDLSVVGVGHRVPTGYIDRHLVLSVEGIDAGGRPVGPLAGPRLPPYAGKSLANRPGKLFGRVLTDPNGKQPAPFWSARGEVEDTRLDPDRPDRLAWRFPDRLHRVEVRVVYRRFWPEVVEAKGWPDREVVVFEQRFTGLHQHEHGGAEEKQRHQGESGDGEPAARLGRRGGR